MVKPKTYEGFWLGRNWVSRCKRCGNLCFTVAQEEEHSREKCVKVKLIPIPEEDRDFHRKQE
jgi:hypothetical protein